MLDSISHRSGPFYGSKESVFKYYQNLEEYPQRYPKYCKWVEVVDRSENIVTTKVFWIFYLLVT
jgi:hypothetical protein